MELEGETHGNVERKLHNELVSYLLKGEYPVGATKVEKGVIRKRAKKYNVIDGILHYKDVLKDGHTKLKQVSLSYSHRPSS